ncbi:hypothetical protein ACFE04_020404 [Oxalis oulophora]
MATNRFICEVCNKGFQREQNLQLHRRGHNLPWKLKQKSTKEVRRKVYLCPEASCVHHDPSRALGDLTGIKKHYSRKHGEKKFKCDKCSKRYAVQSDWKAHSKTCGTREYRCDCGTLFSRRDSFVTHRAFCDALAQESGRHPSSSLTTSHLYAGGTNMNMNMNMNMGLGLDHENNNNVNDDMLRLGGGGGGVANSRAAASQLNNILPILMGSSTPPAAPNMFMQEQFPYEFSRGSMLGSDHHHHHHQINSSLAPSLFSTDSDHRNNIPAPHMSATALLQKAAQLGSTSSSNTSASLLRSFGSSTKTNMNKASDHQQPMGNFGGIFNENYENNFHDLMNSFASGNAAASSIFGAHDNNNNNNNNNNNTNTLNDNRQKSQQNNIGLDDSRLTRDFLGVGQIMRSVSSTGGHGPVSFSQRESNQPQPHSQDDDDHHGLDHVAPHNFNSS